MKYLTPQAFKYLGIITFLLAPFSSKGSWSNWRGPSYNGASDTTSALPEKFSSSKGVKWKTKLPGASAATPIVINDRIFIPSISVPKNSGKQGEGELLALCYSSSSGKLLWSRNAGSGYRPGNSGSLAPQGKR